MKKNNQKRVVSLWRSAKSSLILFSGLIASLASGCKKEFSTDNETTIDGAKAGIAVVSSGNLWYDKFVAYDNAYGNSHYNSTSSATLAWNESYILRSYVIMYEVTKNTAWLTKLTTHVDAILTNATDIGGDGYLDWGTTRYGDGGLYPYMVHDGMITLPIAQFIRLVDRDPTGLSAFAAKASTYQNFIQTEIVPKWSDSNSYMGNCWVQYSSSTGWFKEPSTFESLPDRVYTQLPYNMMAVFAEMLWTMYDVNGNTAYRDRANHIVQYFKNGLTANGTGYSWKYANVATNIEDTSHGNIDISMAVESFNRGGTITGTHIAGLSNTLTNIMWNGSLTAPVVNDRVNGSATTSAHTRVLGGWLRLTQFNGTNWKIGAEQFRNHTIAQNEEAKLYTLAQIIAWDPVKVHNQGFEYKFFSDTTLPARWVRGGTAAEVRRTTTEKFSGIACAAITSTTGDNTWQMLYQDWKEWKPNTTYEVRFNVKTSGSNGARIFMQNVTAGTTIGSVHDYPSSPSWTSQSFTFTTPAAGPALRLYLENNVKSTAGTAYFDNVIIKQVGDAW